MVFKEKHIYINLNDFILNGPNYVGMVVSVVILDFEWYLFLCLWFCAFVIACFVFVFMVACLWL